MLHVLGGLVLCAQVRANDGQLFASLVLFHGDSPRFGFRGAADQWGRDPKFCKELYPHNHSLGSGE
jgi:hypothetical protein